MGAFPMGVLPSGARADVGLVWSIVRHGAPPRSDSDDPSKGSYLLGRLVSRRFPGFV